MRLLDVIADERARYIKEVLQNALVVGEFISLSEKVGIQADTAFLDLVDEKSASEIRDLMARVEIKTTAFDVFGGESYD